MKRYVIDVEGRSNYTRLLYQLKRRKNTELLSHGEYWFGGHTGGHTGYYQIVILTSNIGNLAESMLVYGIVNEDGKLL